MPSVDQLPGDLDLSMIAGDEFSFSATFDTNLAGYTITAYAMRADGTVVANAAVVVTTGASSTVSVTWTETQTNAIWTATNPVTGVPMNKVFWGMRWVSPVGYTRTVLGGSITVSIVG